MGALFIGVVLAFPNGLAGLYDQYARSHVTKALDRWVDQLTRSDSTRTAQGVAHERQ